MRVYISSTIADLHEERDLIRDIVQALGLHPIVYEEFIDHSADSASPMRQMHKEIEQADIFLGIYGRYYGHIPNRETDGKEYTDNTLSYVHLEFQWALEHRILMLLFIRADEDEEGRHIKHKIVETEPYRVSQFSGFLDELRNSSQPVFPFSTTENLRHKAGAELIRVILKKLFKTERDIVFVSHSSKDDRFVNTLSKNLVTAGVEPWLDHTHILPGADWDATIESALDAASALILVLTPDANKSIVTKAEWSYAAENGKTLVPLLLKDTKIPFRLRVLQYVDFRTDRKGNFVRLLKALGIPEKIINRTPWKR